MVLAQVEYRMGKQDLPDELDWGLLEHFNLILFADAGWVATVDPHLELQEGFDDLSWETLKSDVGIALANRSGNIRFEVARRTDRAKDAFVFTFRIHRTF